ncbi:LiaI-LiaF-like domain-containing protein [Ferdinandcohnia sp. Marseille-Q9671]
MKKNNIFSGIILVGFGCYLLLQQLNIPLFTSFFSWQTLVTIAGIAFLVQAYGENNPSSILPGVILVGFGFHFHSINLLSFWPKQPGTLLFIIGVGLLLTYFKTKNGLIHSVVVLFVSLLFLNYNRFMSWLGFIEGGFSFILNYWPLLLVGIGFYLLFIKKK